MTSNVHNERLRAMSGLDDGATKGVLIGGANHDISKQVAAMSKACKLASVSIYECVSSFDRIAYTDDHIGEMANSLADKLKELEDTKETPSPHSYERFIPKPIGQQRRKF